MRTYLIHRMAPLDVDAAAIVTRLEEETDLTARRALVLGLGEFSERQLPLDERVALVPNCRRSIART